MSSVKFLRHRELKGKPRPKRKEELFKTSEKLTFKSFWERNMTKETRKETIFSWLMLVLVVVEATFLFLQAGKGFSSKSAEDVDLAAFVILLVTNIMWLLYGTIVLKDLPVMVSGFLYSVGAILVIVTVIMYGDQ